MVDIFAAFSELSDWLVSTPARTGIRTLQGGYGSFPKQGNPFMHPQLL